MEPDDKIVWQGSLISRSQLILCVEPFGDFTLYDRCLLNGDWVYECACINRSEALELSEAILKYLNKETLEELKK